MDKLIFTPAPGMILETDVMIPSVYLEYDITDTLHPVYWICQQYRDARTDHSYEPVRLAKIEGIFLLHFVSGGLEGSPRGEIDGGLAG